MFPWMGWVEVLASWSGLGGWFVVFWDLCFGGVGCCGSFGVVVGCCKAMGWDGIYGVLGGVGRLCFFCYGMKPLGIGMVDTGFTCLESFGYLIQSHQSPCTQNPHCFYNDELNYI